MAERVPILVVGCGHMGSSHARAYAANRGFRLVGVVSRGPESRGRLSRELGVPAFGDFRRGLAETRPAAVSVCTYPDTHARYALAAMRAGADVFVEKPLARTVAEARRVVAAAKRMGRRVVVGYILRHHPTWARFVEIARGLGRPLVMRMNLNQQSSGAEWAVHLRLLESLSPIADCGVHYVDMMCLMTGARPVRVQAVGARLSPRVPRRNYNWGQLQVVFADGSVGWYEAGWGPMISEAAYFVKDAVGPRGCVSMVRSGGESSADIGGHTRAERLLVHRAELDRRGRFRRRDRLVDAAGEPGHEELCEREAAYFLRAIRGQVDLSGHLRDAVNSLRIVLAADRSVRTGRPVRL
jgi:predicted dehydrogenase